MPGKRPDLTVGKKAVILDALAEGMTVEAAMKRVDMSRNVFYVWKRKAKEGREPYATFMKQVDEVKGQLNALDPAVTTKEFMQVTAPPAVEEDEQVFEPETRQMIIQGSMVMVSDEEIAGYAGITLGQLTRALYRGDNPLEGDDPRYVDFAREFYAARARGDAGVISNYRERAASGSAAESRMYLQDRQRRGYLPSTIQTMEAVAQMSEQADLRETAAQRMLENYERSREEDIIVSAEVVEEKDI